MAGKNDVRISRTARYWGGNTYHHKSVEGLKRATRPRPMDNANVVELLDRVREIVVRSIEAQEHEQHEVATRLLVEARDKIDQMKQLLTNSSAAGES